MLLEGTPCWLKILKRKKLNATIKPCTRGDWYGFVCIAWDCITLNSDVSMKALWAIYIAKAKYCNIKKDCLLSPRIEKNI